MRLDSDGAQMWSPEVVEVDGVASEKGRLPVAGAADGAMILIWEDGRGGDPDVYAQRLGLDGEIAGDSTVATSVQFQRGDCSSDDLFDIADAVSALGFLFVTGVPACVDACDGNDDGVFDISDPVFVLNALFLPGSSLPPAPHPTCGSDPTADTLDCVQPVCP